VKNMHATDSDRKLAQAGFEAATCEMGYNSESQTLVLR